MTQVHCNNWTLVTGGSLERCEKLNQVEIIYFVEKMPLYYMYMIKFFLGNNMKR